MGQSPQSVRQSATGTKSHLTQHNFPRNHGLHSHSEPCRASQRDEAMLEPIALEMDYAIKPEA